MPEFEEVELNYTNNNQFISERLHWFYICKIYGKWFGGHFSKEWYGLNFNNWGTSGISLNSIEQVWLVKGLN